MMGGSSCFCFRILPHLLPADIQGKDDLLACQESHLGAAQQAFAAGSGVDAQQVDTVISGGDLPLGVEAYGDDGTVTIAPQEPRGLLQVALGVFHDLGGVLDSHDSLVLLLLGAGDMMRGGEALQADGGDDGEKQDDAHLLHHGQKGLISHGATTLPLRRHSRSVPGVPSAC